MKYLIVFMLVCGTCYGADNWEEFSKPGTVLTMKQEDKIVDQPQYLIFDEYKIGTDDILAMTDEEIDKMTVLIKLCTSGVYFDNAMVNALAKRFLPERFKVK